MSEYISTEDAAKLLKVSKRRVQAMVKSGRLKATQFGRVWLIRPEDLKPLIPEENRKRGRPPKE